MNTIIKAFLTSLVLLAAGTSYGLDVSVDSTHVNPVSPPVGPMIYTTAYLNLALTSSNSYSSCTLAAGPNNYCPVDPSPSPSGTSPPPTCNQPSQYRGYGLGTWYNLYVTCPRNSLQVTTFTINSNSLQACVCNSSTNCPTSNSSVTMSSTGNLGLNIGTITCFVPVQTWLPTSIAENGGTTTMYGSSVYITHWGTMPLIQPSQSVTSFAATFNVNVNLATNGTWSGEYADLMQQIIPGSAFDIQTVYFAGCGCLLNKGCGISGKGC